MKIKTFSSKYGTKTYTGYSTGESSACVIYHIVTFGCERWIVKKAEWQRIDSNCGAGEDS